MICRRVQRRLTVSGNARSVHPGDVDHAASCPRCTRYLQRDAAIVDLLHRASVPEPDEQFEARLLRGLHRAMESEPPSRMPAWPDRRVAWLSLAAAALLVAAFVGFEGFRAAIPRVDQKPIAPAAANNESGSRLDSRGLFVDAESRGEPAVDPRVFPLAPTNAHPEQLEYETPRPFLIHYEP